MHTKSNDICASYHEATVAFKVQTTLAWLSLQPASQSRTTIIKRVEVQGQICFFSIHYAAKKYDMINSANASAFEVSMKTSRC
jgi:hypothetical protein